MVLSAVQGGNCGVLSIACFEYIIKISHSWAESTQLVTPVQPADMTAAGTCAYKSGKSYHPLE